MDDVCIKKALNNKAVMEVFGNGYAKTVTVAAKVTWFY